MKVRAPQGDGERLCVPAFRELSASVAANRSADRGGIGWQRSGPGRQGRQARRVPQQRGGFLQRRGLGEANRALSAIPGQAVGDVGDAGFR